MDCVVVERALSTGLICDIEKTAESTSAGITKALAMPSGSKVLAPPQRSDYPQRLPRYAQCPVALHKKSRTWRLMHLSPPPRADEIFGPHNLGFRCAPPQALCCRPLPRAGLSVAGLRYFHAFPIDFLCKAMSGDAPPFFAVLQSRQICLTQQ
jgi:hypothetical protein